MAGVNAAMPRRLNSDVQLINQFRLLRTSAAAAGNIRPMIAVLWLHGLARLPKCAYPRTIALIEFIHTATPLATLWMNQICAGLKLPPTPHLAMPPACW